ncbi:hypothetical protein E2C01_094716 [Portunus trituberculatus]|uniref:Uncharacterized protein n=1 Tax=Portunus trituberculatus TaxID=210409 RepID=A0A5B7JR69_PORTR|nr:hypothetical protein [Portunus trituberculatus]
MRVGRRGEGQWVLGLEEEEEESFGVKRGGEVEADVTTSHLKPQGEGRGAEVRWVKGSEGVI